MTISAISSFSASQTSNYQNYRQAFSQLANALQSGDLDGVQKALATLQQQQRAHGHHHHHHGGVSSQNSMDSSAPSGDTETSIPLFRSPRPSIPPTRST
jgi:hypothetical protein